MRLLAIFCALSLPTAALADDTAQDAVAKRFAESLLSEAAFVATDFLVPIDKDSIQALAIFQHCSLDSINRPIGTYMGNGKIAADIKNKIAITLRCRGVPRSSPAGLSLIFEGDKISSVETHNADLVLAGLEGTK